MTEEEITTLHSNLVQFKLCILVHVKPQKITLHSNLVQFKLPEKNKQIENILLYIPIWYNSSILPDALATYNI